MFRTLLLANSLRQLTREVRSGWSEPRGICTPSELAIVSQLAHDAFTRDDLDNIRSLSKQRDVLHQLARSLAPSICGHEHEKV